MIRNLINVSSLTRQNKDNEHPVNFDMIVKNRLSANQKNHPPHINTMDIYNKNIDTPLITKTSITKNDNHSVSYQPKSTAIRKAISSFCISILMMEMLNKNNNIIDEDQQF